MPYDIHLCLKHSWICLIKIMSGQMGWELLNPSDVILRVEYILTHLLVVVEVVNAIKQLFIFVNFL